MNTGEARTLALDVRFTAQQLWLRLADGREVGVPVRLYPTLAKATPPSRDNWRLVGDGAVVHWPELDLDLETQQIVDGEPEALPAPPKLRRRPLRLSRAVFHVRFRSRDRSWMVSQHKPSNVIGRFRSRREAEAEAISLGRMVGPSQVVVHRKSDDRVTRRFEVGSEKS